MSEKTKDMPQLADATYAHTVLIINKPFKGSPFWRVFPALQPINRIIRVS